MARERKPVAGMGNPNPNPNPTPDSDKGVKPPTNASTDFEAFFNTGISLAELKEGCYECTLADYKFIKNVKDDAKSYVRLELELPDRIILDNRFKNNFNLFLTQVKRQLNMQDTKVSVPELLKSLTHTKFKVWIEYVIVDKKQFRNLSYIEPITEDKEDKEEDKF